MKLIFYGRLAEAIGAGSEVDPGPGSSVAEIREQLCKMHPKAATVLRRSRAFIGDVLVGDNELVRSTDEIAFLPPVSGG